MKKKGDLKKSLEKYWKAIITFLGAFWYFAWKDDSPQGWVVSIIIIFIFIKFIFFPVLSLVTGTSLPLAIVESCSMYHDGNVFSNFDGWWDKHESKYAPYIINDLDFRDFAFKNGFNKGDILFIVGAKPEKLEVGDVIIFNAGRNNPIIHRIRTIENTEGKYTFSTIGDNNNGQLSIEKEISSEQLVGKALPIRLPYIGWLKLAFYEPSRPVSEKGFCDER
ncbi:signal peptidase I [Candidatus Pacearchaeota archaeon]|nr:signal peptidase I [Candidatus Pacearchaeota archaeon]